MASTQEIEKVMINDQSMTTKILKMVNSAYYAIPGGVTTVSRAIAYLGFDTVNQLVLGSSIISALDVEDSDVFNLKAFWQHSLGVAMAAEIISDEMGVQKQADLFTAGLVHDMGKIALAVIAPETLAKSCEIAKNENISLYEAESQIGLPLHTEIGGLLAKKWKLPVAIQTAIRFHHTLDPAKRTGVLTDHNKIIDIVSLANLLIHALKFGNSGHDKIVGAPKNLLERLDLSADPKAITTLVTAIKKKLVNADSFLRIIES